MAHRKSPADPILKYRIPIPACPQEEQIYLDLGWIYCGSELMWSHARGTPRHPGDAVSDERPLLEQLPVAVLVEALERLPPIGDCDDRCLEVPVMVLIRYGRYSSKANGVSYSSWMAESAKVIGLAAELPK